MLIHGKESLGIHAHCQSKCWREAPCMPPARARDPNSCLEVMDTCICKKSNEGQCFTIRVPLPGLSQLEIPAREGRWGEGCSWVLYFRHSASNAKWHRTEKAAFEKRTVMWKGRGKFLHEPSTAAIQTCKTFPIFSVIQHPGRIPLGFLAQHSP